MSTVYRFSFRSSLKKKFLAPEIPLRDFFVYRKKINGPGCMSEFFDPVSFLSLSCILRGIEKGILFFEKLFHGKGISD